MLFSYFFSLENNKNHLKNFHLTVQNTNLKNAIKTMRTLRPVSNSLLLHILNQVHSKLHILVMRFKYSRKFENCQHWVQNGDMITL